MGVNKVIASNDILTFKMAELPREVEGH